jgi:hypothetical protein
MTSDEARPADNDIHFEQLKNRDRSAASATSKFSTYSSA